MRYKLQDEEKHQPDSTIFWLTIWTFSIFIYALCYFSLITPRVILGQCFSNFKVYITDLAPCWKAESDLGIQRGPEMLHKLPAVADSAGPHTSDHALNNEADDRLLEREKTLSLLLLDPTPTNSSVSICYPISQEAEIAHTPFPCPMTITAYWVCPAAHQVLPILPPKFLLHMFPPLHWHYITVSWLVFLFPLIHPLHFCQNDNPETGFSLPQRKKSDLYLHSIQATFTLWLPFNLPGWYYIISTYKSWAPAIQNRSRFPEGTMFFYLPALCMPYFLSGKFFSPALLFMWDTSLNTQLKCYLLSEAFRNSIMLSAPLSILSCTYTKFSMFSGVHILQCFIRFLYLGIYPYRNWGFPEIETVSYSYFPPLMHRAVPDAQWLFNNFLLHE